MKKKFLSLMMAAAVVATTSVSAFANTKEYNNIPEDQSISHDVKITGDVEDVHGQVKPGTLSVTVPTTATFRVKNDGKFEGSKLEVVNRSNQSIEVFVDKFVDVDETENINVVSAADTSKANGQSGAVDRKHVSLNITGNGGVAYLGTAPGAAKNGVYSDPNLQNGVNSKKVSEIAANDTDTLNLNGEAGKAEGSISNPVQNGFTLKLAIRKKTVNQTPGETANQVSGGGLSQ